MILEPSTITSLFSIENFQLFVDFAIDDNIKKIGFYTPGSKIPIYDSRCLSEKNISLCVWLIIICKPASRHSMPTSGYVQNSAWNYTSLWSNKILYKKVFNNCLLS